jgi:RHS repeat-associated protein
MRLIRLFALLSCVLSMTAHAQLPAAGQQDLYIVVLQPAKAEAAPFDVTKHGGTLEYRSGSRLAVRLPEAAVEGVKQNPLVRHVQKVVVGAPVRRVPAITADRELTGQAELGTHFVTTVTYGPYGYDGSGNIRSIGPSTQPSVYTYDRVGRLATAATYSGTTLYQQSFSYDPAGNMTSVTLNGQGTALPVQGSTNRLATASGFTYDQAGHMTASPMSSSYAWDQLEMLKSDGSAPYTNVYTASDERLAVITTSGTPEWRWTLRDLSNQRVRDFESFGPTGTEYFVWLEDSYHDGTRVIASRRLEEEGGWRHFHTDHLGTPRLTTNEEGRQISRHDYLPYGVELTSLRQERTRGFDREQVPHFTGHERDYLELRGDDGHRVYLDYMHARVYNPNWGRFLSVDPFLNVKRALREPQNWNRYVYVMNNPLRYTDPDGRDHYQEPGFTKPYSEWGEALQMDENTPPIVRYSNYAAGGLTVVGAAGFLGAGGLVASAKENLSAAGTWALANWDKIQRFAEGVVDFFTPGPSSGRLTSFERASNQLANQLQFTATTAGHMTEAGRMVPRPILAQAILSGARSADPQGARGAVQITQNIVKNGKDYVLKIIYREKDKTILHFHYAAQ